VASIQTASPALIRAIRCRSPNSSVRENPTYRRRRWAATRCAWAAGSASITLASQISNTRPGACPAIASATAASTTPTTSSGSRRVSRATLRASHTGHPSCTVTAQVFGNR
jgi:hypothetical protein